MLKPVLFSITGAMLVVAVVAATNLAGVLTRQSEIRDEGIRISDVALNAAYKSFAGANSARLKSDHVTYIQRAKASPLTRESDWQNLTPVSACNDFWRMTRQVTDNVARSFGQSGLYSEEELDFASRAAQVSMGVVAVAMSSAASQSNYSLTQQTDACKAGIQAVLAFEAEGIRRVHRNLSIATIPPEALAEQTVTTLSAAMPAFMRKFNAGFSR